MHFKKYLAELVGTFTLTFAVLVSLSIDMHIPTPVVAGLTLGLFVYTVGHISGAHLNPAVTIALASIRKINTKEAALYVVSQFIGALLAMQAGAAAGMMLPGLSTANTAVVLFAEALGAFLLVFGICSVVYSKVKQDSSGLTIGGSLFLGIVVASHGSNGILNPAVSIGVGSISAMYLLGPVVGGLIAAWLYRWMAE